MKIRIKLLNLEAGNGYELSVAQRAIITRRLTEAGFDEVSPCNDTVIWFSVSNSNSGAMCLDYQTLLDLAQEGKIHCENPGLYWKQIEATFTGLNESVIRHLTTEFKHYGDKFVAAFSA